MRDPETGNSKGYAFINFASFDASDAAIEAMNGQFLCNRAITISYAFKKEAKGERHGSAAERLLAAQNPLAQADRPHQLFADAPPTPNAMPPMAPMVAVPPMAVPAPPQMMINQTMPPPGMPPPGMMPPPGFPPPGMPPPGMPHMPSATDHTHPPGGMPPPPPPPQMGQPQMMMQPQFQQLGPGMFPRPPFMPPPGNRPVILPGMPPQTPGLLGPPPLMDTEPRGPGQGPFNMIGQQRF